MDKAEIDAGINQVPVLDQLVCPWCDRLLNGRPYTTREIKEAVCSYCNFWFCPLCNLDFHWPSSCAAAWNNGKAMLRHKMQSYKALSSVTRKILETKGREKQQAEEERKERAERAKYEREEEDDAVTETLKEMKKGGMEHKELQRRERQMRFKGKLERLERAAKCLKERLDKGELVESMYNKELQMLVEKKEKASEEYEEEMRDMVKKWARKRNLLQIANNRWNYRALDGEISHRDMKQSKKRIIRIDD